MADPLPPFTNPCPDEPFREPVAKLAKLITDRIPVVLGLEKITKDSPEYIGIRALVTDEEAEVLQGPQTQFHVQQRVLAYQVHGYGSCLQRLYFC